jgi:hypothetical protein
MNLHCKNDLKFKWVLGQGQKMREKLAKFYWSDFSSLSAQTPEDISLSRQLTASWMNSKQTEAGR